jgi:hypothetical protein
MGKNKDNDPKSVEDYEQMSDAELLKHFRQAEQAKDEWDLENPDPQR